MAAITLRQLQIFDQVIAHGSFRRCADQMGISQVAVSEHVRELEQRLGRPLFDRRVGGRATLTADGERAHRQIAKILKEVDFLLTEFAIPRGQPGHRELKLGMQAYLLRKLQKTLLEFGEQQLAVHIELDLTVHTAPQVLQRLHARTLDMAYFFALDVPTDLESEYAWTEPLRIFVGAGHPLARCPRPSLSDLARTGCIQLLPENPLRPLINEVLRRGGMADPKVVMETNELGLILSSVQKGLGFVCMFEQSGTGFIHPESLVPLELEQPLPSMQVRRVLSPRCHEDDIVRSLWQRLKVQHDSE